MFYCEECRVEKKWPRPPTYPYHNRVTAQCEICNKFSVLYNVPALHLKPEEEKSVEEKLLDKMIQEEYKKKCEAMVLTVIEGTLAGAVDHKATNELQESFIEKSGKIDWYATYELRQTIQKHHDAVKKIERDRRLI
jgi:hypothetical protein